MALETADAIYFASGTLCLLGVSVDLLWTTLWVQGGAGPLTSRLMSLVWKALGRAIGSRKRLLTVSGPTVLVVSLVVWMTLLWVGWTLLFAGGEQVLTDTRENGPISWAERFYYTGYSIFTLGNGDFSPRDGAWQIATVLATASGMLYVTLTVTYVLSVLGAVTQKRAFASGVSGLGDQSVEILRRSWTGEEFEGLELPLNTLASEIDTLTANHKAYPVLHYFYSASDENAPTVSVAVLDELLTVLRFGTTQRRGSREMIVDSLRSGVEDYLETLGSAFAGSADQPPPPNLRSLREAGVPTVSEEEFADSLSDLEERRRQLLGLVESDRREWPNRDRDES